MKTLAVIGTAGRQDDAAKLTARHWNAMCRAAIEVCASESVTDLVSGGAAWADHVAPRVALHLGLPVRLWLPANERDYGIAKWYHSKFSNVLGRDTWDEVLQCSCEAFGGFKDRNTKVAQAAHVFLACTFGHGAEVKDGGTADTVAKLERRGIAGYHFDMNTLTLHKRPQPTPSFL